MNDQKIAVVVDSGCDLPENLRTRDDVFVLPFHIIYKNAEYISNVDITSEEVMARLKEEVPTTSLPSGEDILNVFDQVKAAGFAHALVVNISAALSGTHNLVNLISQNYEGLDIHTVNTKSIGIGAGFFAVDALALIDEGASFEDICARMTAQVSESKVFFSLMTLEYLQKGGRIGLVSSILGSALRIKPVISCNEDGVYYTVKKTRGRKQSLAELVNLAEQFAAGAKRYRLAMCFSAHPEEATAIREEVKARFKNFVGQILDIQIDASLGIHTGPNLIGLSVYRLPDHR